MVARFGVLKNIKLWPGCLQSGHLFCTFAFRKISANWRECSKKKNNGSDLGREASGQKNNNSDFGREVFGKKSDVSDNGRKSFGKESGVSD